MKELSDYWFGSFPSFEEACGPDFAKVIIPVIRRVMPSIIAQDIIGVQPMTGPVDQIHTLRTKYSNSQKSKLDQVLENTKQYLEKKNNENK